MLAVLQQKLDLYLPRRDTGTRKPGEGSKKTTPDGQTACSSNEWQLQSTHPAGEARPRGGVCLEGDAQVKVLHVEEVDGQGHIGHHLKTQK